MATELSLLWAYALRVSPGVFMTLLFCSVLPHKLEVIRVLGYIVIFVQLRDTMTPMGFWTIKSSLSEGVFWIRMSKNPLLLSLLGVLSLIACQFFQSLHMMYHRLGGNSVLIWKCKGVTWMRTILLGFGGGLLIALPCLVTYLYVPISERGGEVPLPLLMVLLFFCLAGNLLEELLFRGFFQGYLQTVDELKLVHVSRLKRIMLSASLFSMMHSFLAASVTNQGVGVILFTFYEGLITAYLREKCGIWCSTLAHGLGIFLLSAGLY